MEQSTSQYSTDKRPQLIPCCSQALSLLTQCCFVFICFCTTLLVLYLCVVLVSCTYPFREHVCRPSLLCNPCLLTKIDNNNNWFCEKNLTCLVFVWWITKIIILYYHLPMLWQHFLTVLFTCRGKINMFHNYFLKLMISHIKLNTI